MAWVFLIDGAAVTSAEGDYDLEEAVEKDAAYEELKEKASGAGLKMVASVNSDEGGVSFIIGHELLPNRHVYQGQTHVCPAPESKVAEFDAFVEQLENLVKRHATGDVSVARGIVLNQFD